MTRLVFILAMLVSSICNGQWWKRTPHLNEMKYRLDTLRYRGDMVLLQRYKPADLLSFEDNSDPDMAVGFFVQLLQLDLDSYKSRLSAGLPSTVTHALEDKIRQIAALGTGFDTSYFEAEYRFYYKYRNALTDEEYAVIERRVNFELDVLRKEDSNVVTPFDSLLASKYTPYNDHSVSEYVAHQKIVRIERAADEVRRDSVFAAKEAAYLARIAPRPATKPRQKTGVSQELVKKYGAEDAGRISQGKVVIGWDKEMCERAWGKPLRTHKNTTLRRVEETWIYPRSRKLVFIHDVLVRISE